MNIIFLGAPGSGKGTQASMVSKRFGIPPISTGEVLRKEVEINSEIGKLAKSYISSGQLVPDEVVVGIIKKRIVEADCQNGFILDGFPRNINQAVALDKMLESLEKRIEIVFNFEVEEEVLIKRISGRFSCKFCSAVYNKYFKQPKIAGICDNCGSNQFESRSDDNQDVVRNRLKVYHQSTFPLIEFYQKKNLLISVCAVETAPLIFEKLISVISKDKF